MPDNKHTIEVHRQDIDDIEDIQACLRDIDMFRLLDKAPQDVKRRHQRATEAAERLHRIITSA